MPSCSMWRLCCAYRCVVMIGTRIPTLHKSSSVVDPVAAAVQSAESIQYLNIPQISTARPPSASSMLRTNKCCARKMIMRACLGETLLSSKFLCISGNTMLYNTMFSVAAIGRVIGEQRNDGDSVAFLFFVAGGQAAGGAGVVTGGAGSTSQHCGFHAQWRRDQWTRP